MKPLILIMVATMISIPMIAQQKSSDILPLKNNKIMYTDIVSVDNLSKPEIYKRAKFWLANNCESIRLDENDQLIGRNYIQIGSASIWHTIIIKIKDGRYKYEITDFQIKEKDVLNGNSIIVDSPLETYHTFLNIGEKSAYKNIDIQINALIESFQKAIKTNTEDNW